MVHLKPLWFPTEVRLGRLGVPYSQVPAANIRQVLPGYFSTPEAPGDLFACSGFAHCPGGSPGTCAQGAL